MITQSKTETEQQQIKQEYEKYQQYLDSKLRIDQQKCQENLQKFKQKQEEYRQVQQYIKASQLTNSQNQKLNIDIGSQFFMQGQVLKSDTIILDVGLGVFVELKFEEALPIIKQRIDVIQKNIDKIQTVLANTKANVKAFEATLNRIESLAKKNDN